MGNEKIRKVLYETLYISIILLICFYIRMFICNTQKYLMNIDSYAYLRQIEDGSGGFEFMHLFSSLESIQTTLIFFTLATSLMIYFTCRLYKADAFSSFIAGLFFSFSPLVFFNNQFGIIDKNVPSLFMIVIGIFIMGYFKSWKRILVLIPYFLLFGFIWEGAVGMLILIAFYYVINMIIDNKFFGVLVSCCVITLGFFLSYGKFKMLTNPTDWALISELNPIWNIGLFAEYLLLIIIWILVFTKIRLEKKDQEKINNYLFLYIGFIISFLVMCFIFRLNIFFTPFLYIWMAILLTDLEYKKSIKILVLILLAGFIIGTSMNIYFRQPVMNDGLKDALDYVNTLPTDCLIGVWSKGHIYNYYTDKEVLFRAVASRYKEQIAYMVNGQETNCAIIWDNNDVLALKYMIIYDNSLLDSLVVPPTQDDPSTYYIIKNINKAKAFEYYNNTYYVLGGLK